MGQVEDDKHTVHSMEVNLALTTFGDNLVRRLHGMTPTHEVAAMLAGLRSDRLIGPDDGGTARR